MILEPSSSSWLASSSSVVTSPPLLRVAGEAGFLGDVGDLHAGVVDLAGAPPARQDLPVGPDPLPVVSAGHHRPELQRPRRRQARAPRRPVVACQGPPARRRPDLRDVDGDDVGLAALVEQRDGQLVRRAAPLLHTQREVLALVLARHPAHARQRSQP
uniref:Predicted protein n=1 Tax=Hordeum vulgare subsp. vulgare TaxID=112509 RepID=F2DV36_HORVV|nr:predicted protein [Hordeum vulgare subsp. vulgare]